MTHENLKRILEEAYGELSVFIPLDGDEYGRFSQERRDLRSQASPWAMHEPLTAPLAGDAKVVRVTQFALETSLQASLNCDGG